MTHLTATDAAANLIALTLLGLTPHAQSGDLSIISEIAKLSPAALLAFILLAIWRGELVPKGMVERLTLEFKAALEVRDKALAIVIADHMKALELIDRERSREREQSEARHAATIAHYEARLEERGSLLKENTSLLARAVELLNEQQKKAA
jgi:hypothetical protein